MRRIHTREGVHPYDEVTWERRDVVMTNWRDGSVNFEQHGVEFPEFWSVNAANIVTTKYFRGAVGTPQREWSLKQLIDRVVGTYRAAGVEHGYFRTDRDAEIFDHELTHALLHQVFSFNSPVWFNVGTSSPQQVSACQPYDALVSTQAGEVPIGALVTEDAVGTKVYDAHGVTRVVATKANGVKEVLRLHTRSGRTLDVTPDHLVWRATDLVVGEFTVAGFVRPGDSLLHVVPDVGGSDRSLAEVARVERLGPMEVYDIQTDSGEYLSGSLRVHNCFILAVDDTMDSILEWYREEGLIFKGGSGAGVNLSGSAPARSCSPRAARPAGRSRSCVVPMPRQGLSSRAAPPGARPRWSCSTSTTPMSRNSSRPRPGRKKRSGSCAMAASIWIWAARTSPASSTRMPITRCGSPTSSCARSRTVGHLTWLLA